MKRRLPWKLIFLLWLAFALRAWRLDAQSLWYDEGYSAYLGAHLPLKQALDLTVRDIVPPLYYLALRLWLPWVGTSEYALRFLSVALGVVAVAVMARLGRRLSAPLAAERGKLLSAGLATVAPVLIWLSQDARMYGPLVTWSLLSTWGLLRAVAPAASQKSRRRGWLLFVVAGLAALYTHTVAVFWLLGQVTFALLATWSQRRQRERVRETLVALGALALGYVPWVIVALISYQANAGYWPGYLPPPYLWRIAWDAFVGGQHLSPAQTDLAAVWFGGAVLLAWLILLFKRPRLAVYLLCYLAVPLLAMGVAFQNTPKLAPRYPTAMAPALFVILAAGTTAVLRGTDKRSHVLRLACYTLLIGVLLLSLHADANLLFNADYGKDNWRAVAEYVRTHRRPDETVLLVSGHPFPVWAYYYGWEGWHGLPDDLQLDITHVLNYSSVAPELNRVLEGTSGVWLVLWQDKVVDPTHLVPTLLGDVGRELPAPSFPGSTAGDPVTLRHYEILTKPHFSTALPVQQSLQESVAPHLTSLGYWLPSEPLPADAEIAVRVFWQAEQALQGAHAASLRLYDRLGQEWARQDALLAGPWYFSERWPANTPIMGVYTATLPPGTPPGVYTPTLTVYRDDERFGTLHLSSLVVTRPHKMATALDLALPPVWGQAGALALIGAGFDQQTTTPCQDWYLSLAWRAEGNPGRDYRLRLSAGPYQIDTSLAADYPTTHWQPGDLWRTRHHIPIGCRALDGTMPVTAQLLDAKGRPVDRPLDLGALTVIAGRQFTPPADLTARMNVHLEGVGALAGYRLERAQVRPGENLKVALYWRAEREIVHNFSIFVHLQDDERVWAQHDGWPANGHKPTSTWAPQEVVEDQHIVTIGADVPPGSYRLVVGMYDAATLQPVAASGPDGRPMEGGRITLQPITVYAP